MQIKYHLEGSERKALLAAIRGVLQDTPKYMGPPTFSFVIGPYTIDRHGTLDCPDDVDPAQAAMLIHELERDGFIGERIGEPLRPNGQMPTKKFASQFSGDLDLLVIELSKDNMTPSALENLRRLVASKATLLKKRSVRSACRSRSMKAGSSSDGSGRPTTRQNLPPTTNWYRGSANWREHRSGY